MTSPVLNNRGFDFEGLAGIDNADNVVILNAASANNHALRKGEFDAEVVRLDAAIAEAAGASHNHVDTTSLDLTEALAGASFAGDTWTFGSDNLHVGDVLFLDAATEQDSDRAFLMIAANGVEADFKPFGSDIDAAINAAKFSRANLAEQYSGADGLFIDDTNGFIGINDSTLRKAKLDNDLVNEIDSKSRTIEYAVVWGAADGNGVSTCTLDTSSDFGTRSLQVRILKDLGDGFFEHISTSAIEIASSNTAVRIRTDSGSVLAATLVVEVTGVPVV